jgi:putative ABC transport system permease protein
MLAHSDNLSLTLASLRAHKLRASLTMLGLTMGVATLITVMTLVQGANRYVELKIANLGTNVFQLSRMPFAVTDYNQILKALRNKHIELEDMRALAEVCRHCRRVGGEVNATVRTRYGDRELTDTGLIGQTATMADIDTRTITQGRFFTEAEDRNSAQVCLIGHRLQEEFFPGLDPIGRTLRVADQEFVVIGTYDKIGSVLGQEQDNFVVVPMNTFRKMRGSRTSITISVEAVADGLAFERAQDEARLALRARRQLSGNEEDDFFIGTKESFMDLWKRISSAFFAVFIMVSSISALIGGIVIMNVMLVSVTERTKEIGVRRAVGATERDILRQFLTESVVQCLIGGAIGIALGFAVAALLRTYTSFPTSVETWVVIAGLGFSSLIGLFFGIYPATRAAHLDPVAALRSE